MVYDRTAHARRAARRARARLPACDRGPSCTGRRARPQRSRLLRLRAVRPRGLPRRSPCSTRSPGRDRLQGRAAAARDVPADPAAPTLAFVVQEFLERFIHAGHVPWTTAFEPAFLFGLALQLPFALAALLLAWALDSAARAVGQALAAVAPANLLGLCPRSRPRRRGSAPRRARARVRRTRTALPSLTVVSVGRGSARPRAKEWFEEKQHRVGGRPWSRWRQRRPRSRTQSCRRARRRTTWSSGRARRRSRCASTRPSRRRSGRSGSTTAPARGWTRERSAGPTTARSPSGSTANSLAGPTRSRGE